MVLSLNSDGVFHSKIWSPHASGYYHSHRPYTNLVDWMFFPWSLLMLRKVSHMDGQIPTIRAQSSSHRAVNILNLVVFIKGFGHGDCICCDWCGLWCAFYFHGKWAHQCWLLFMKQFWKINERKWIGLRDEFDSTCKVEESVNNLLVLVDLGWAKWWLSKSLSNNEHQTRQSHWRNLQMTMDVGSSSKHYKRL